MAEQPELDGVVYDGPIGPTVHCTEGAYHLFVQNGRKGKIIAYDMHAYYIREGAKPDDIAENLGESYEDGVPKGKPSFNRVMCKTLEDEGIDITTPVVTGFESGKYKFRGLSRE